MAASLACFIAYLLSSTLGIGSDGFKVPLTLVPPLYKVASLRMEFVSTVDTDAITSNAALAIEKGASVSPFALYFDLFSKDNVGSSWPSDGSLAEPPIESLINELNGSKQRDVLTAAFEPTELRPHSPKKTPQCGSGSFVLQLELPVRN